MTKVKPSKFHTCVDFLARMAHHLSYKEGENKFAVAAYQKAHDALKAFGSLDGYETIPGIGSGIRKKLLEIIETGKSSYLADAEHYGPPYSVIELKKIPGVGPKKAMALYTEFGIASLADMQAAINAGSIVDPKLIKGYYDMLGNSDRIPRALVAKAMQPVIEQIKATHGIHRVILPGSFRRLRPDVRDIDVLIEVESYNDVPQLVKTLSRKLGYAVSADAKDGSRKAYMEMPIDENVRKLDLNFIESKSWGTAVLHFTGPASYNQAVRAYIKPLGMSLSQYGLKEAGKLRYFEDEHEVFEAIGLPYVIPSHRDYHSSVAQPDTVHLVEVFGDAHIHSTDSDGQGSLAQLVKMAKACDYEFIGLSDHGPMLNGPSAENLKLRTTMIRRKNFGDLQVYNGAEVDIKSDGSLDYDAKTLEYLDYVILALHMHPGQNTLERLDKAFRKVQHIGVPAILAHPTARIIGKRSEIEVDYGEMFKLCKMYGVVVEINAQPMRCDLPDNLVIQAKRYGLKYAIGSDCHELNSSELLQNGLNVAKRASLAPSDIINSSHDAFKDFLRL